MRRKRATQQCKNWSGPRGPGPRVGGGRFVCWPVNGAVLKKEDSLRSHKKSDGAVSEVAGGGHRPGRLPDSGTSILGPGLSPTDATYPPGVLCFLMVTIKGGGGCMAFDRRSMQYLSGAYFYDLVNVDAFHLWVAEKNLYTSMFRWNINIASK